MSGGRVVMYLHHGPIGICRFEKRRSKKGFHGLNVINYLNNFMTYTYIHAFEHRQAH